MEKPTGSPAVGAKQQIEKQARQLAYDTRYKVKQAMAAKSGGKMDPAAVRKAYMAQLGKSSAAPAVKARAKQMLLGEDYVDAKQLANDSMVSALYKVFVEGIEEPVEEVEVQEETEEKKYKIKVTDKKTGNTYVRMASRSKIAELRRNPNISSVEMTGYGSVGDDEKSKGAKTARAKAGKGLDPVGQEDKDIDNDGDHDKTDKYLLKRRKAIGNAIATRKEEVIYEKDEKEDSSVEKKITGEGVNNKKLIKVYPDVKEQVAAPKKEEENNKPTAMSPQEKQQLEMKKKMLQKKMMMQRQTLQMQKQGRLPLNYSEECGDGEVCDKCGKSPCECESEDPRGMKTKVNLIRNKMRAMGLKMSYEPEGEVVDERTRYAKETGMDPQTGKPSVKGGQEPPAAMKHLQKSFRDTGGMMSSRKKPIQPQGRKKVPGKKGYQGPTPVDKIKGQLARKRAPKPDIGSRFD